MECIQFNFNNNYNRNNNKIMGKLSISFETTTEDKTEMVAIRDFILAISDSGTMSGNTNAPQQIPTEKPKRTPKPKAEPVTDEPTVLYRAPYTKEAVETPISQIPDHAKTVVNSKIVEPVEVKEEPVEVKEEPVEVKEEPVEVKEEPKQVQQATPADDLDAINAMKVFKNDTRTLISEKSNGGHRAKVKEYLDSNGIKGLGTLTDDQFIALNTFLKSL